MSTILQERKGMEKKFNICFEGPDCAGKSILIEKFQEVYTGNTKVIQEVKGELGDLIRNGTTDALEQFGLLIYLRRQAIKEAKNSKVMINIFDRFVWSTMAYQGQYISRDLINIVFNNMIPVGFIDVLFLVLPERSVVRKRLRNRSVLDKIENYYTTDQVYNYYQSLIYFPGRNPSAISTKMRSFCKEIVVLSGDYRVDLKIITNVIKRLTGVYPKTENAKRVYRSNNRI